MEGTQKEQSPYLSGDVPVECVGFVPVSSTTARGPGTVCTGAQREPARVEPLGAQPTQEGTQPHSPFHTPSARCSHMKRPTKVQLPALQTTNARFTPGRGTTFLDNSGDRYKRYAARIGTVSATSAATSTQISTGTRVGSIEKKQRQYPRIRVDWVASFKRETQPRPRLLQRKVPTKANSLHRAHFCRGE